MKKVYLIILILIVGFFARAFVYHKTTDSVFSVSSILEDLLFSAFFFVIILAVFYRKEVKDMFSGKNKS